MHTQAEEITQLHAEHARFVRHVVMRYTRDADVVDDLTQQVWLVVCAKLAAFRAQASFKSWLYRVAVTTALQSLRSEKHRKDREQRFAAALPAGFSHDDVRTAGVALLRSLPPRQRRVVLRWSHGYAHEEIGRALRISTGTSKSQLARARRRLHECLAHLRTDTTTSNKFQAR